jgi:geranyl-CoA carboxylase alpha subunit
VFHKILIANRGEIACRVIRTARALGYRTVAVFSSADSDAPHTRMADEAVCIGGAPAAESYLNIDAILQAAKTTGADALHPGYGFLSENAAFAQACAAAGVCFIGPPVEAIHMMGNKALAKARMREAGVPTAPGYLGENQDPAHLMQEAQKLTMPFLVKAVAGGGGRGIRVVKHHDDLAPAIASARREAQSAFGDGSLMLEGMITDGRHIEIQIFADAHGNAVYLGERDCSAQRRRQKVIEEAPSPILTPDLRARMGRDAVAAALAVGYRGAGTVEFMVDQDMQHYFLEMNTRLQVEHPVTEMITGLDLVEWQLIVAAGLPLPLLQADIRTSGHAIEARLYTEDPYAEFAPQSGQVLHWEPTAATRHAGVRIDDGIQSGSVISPFYDAMAAKIIVHGRDRADALRRLGAALEDAPLIGVRNNGRFLRDLIRHPDFTDARMTTTLLDDWSASNAAIMQRPLADDEAWCLAAAIMAAGESSGGGLSGNDPLRANSVTAFDVALCCDNQTRRLRVAPQADGTVLVTSPQAAHQAAHQAAPQAAHRLTILTLQDNRVRYCFDGVTKQLTALRRQQTLYLVQQGATFEFSEPSAFPSQNNTDQDASRICAPVAGILTQILVAVGDVVTEGQMLACVEAMKMEMWLSAKAAGSVTAILGKSGDQIAAKALVIELELTPPSPPSQPPESR